MGDEYNVRNIDLDKLAEYVRSNDGLEEIPTLHLLDTIRCLQDFGGDVHRQLCMVVNERDLLKAENADLLAALQIVKEQRQLWWGKAVGRTEEIRRLTAEVECLQSLVPHPGDGTCNRCGMGGAKTVTVTFCEECRELEREIAYHAARSDIECICAGHYESGPGSPVWYDIQSPDNDDDMGFVTQAVTYLLQRGLLKRHQENPDLVKPLDAEARP